MTRSDFKFSVSMGAILLVIIIFLGAVVGLMALVKILALVVLGFIGGTLLCMLFVGTNWLLDWIYDKFMSKR